MRKKIPFRLLVIIVVGIALISGAVALTSGSHGPDATVYNAALKTQDASSLTVVATVTPNAPNATSQTALVKFRPPSYAAVTDWTKGSKTYGKTTIYHGAKAESLLSTLAVLGELTGFVRHGNLYVQTANPGSGVPAKYRKRISQKEQTSVEIRGGYVVHVHRINDVTLGGHALGSTVNFVVREINGRPASSY
jgi:hypothetical protein